MPTPIPIGSLVTEATKVSAEMTPLLRKRSVSSAGVTSSAEDQQLASVGIGGVSLKKHDARRRRGQPDLRRHVDRWDRLALCVPEGLERPGRSEPRSAVG